MSGTNFQKGGKIVIEGTIPADKQGTVRAIIYSPKNRKLSANQHAVYTPNGDGSKSFVLTLKVPDLWFTGQVCTAFVDCNQCGYGTGRYVVELLTVSDSNNAQFSELSTGEFTFSGQSPSPGLLEELCPDCSDDDESPTPGDPFPGDGTIAGSDSLTPNPTPPTGDPCLPPNFVNPTPTVPTPCSS